MSKIIAYVIGAVAAVALAIALGWVIGALLVFVGLNLIAGLGLSFAQVVGIGLLVAACSASGSAA